MTPARRLAEVLDTERLRVVTAVVLLVLTIGASVALMGTSAWLISTAALHPSIAALQVAVVGVRFFGLSRGVFRYLERLVSHDATFRLLAALRVGVYRSLVPLVPGRLTLARSGDLLTRLVADVDTLEHAFVRVVGPALAALLVATGVAATLAFFHPAVSLAATAALLAAGTVAPWLAWLAGRRAGRQQVHLRATLGASLVDIVQGMADMLALGAGADRTACATEVSEALARSQAASARAAAASGAFVSLLGDVAVVAVLIAAVPLVEAGAIAGVHLAVVVLVTLAAFEAVAGLPTAAQGLAATSAAAHRVFAFETMPAGPHAVTSLPEPAASMAAPDVRHVQVRGLSFTYPGESVPAVAHIDFDLRPGGVLAIVGPSGSGKSTIAHLLLRFQEPPPGSVLVDGVDLAAIDADLWRTCVALMAQDVHLFTGTVEDNLRVARADATGEAVRKAVEAAGFDEVLARLPEGADTWVGEQGARLSGGERQRLALARALLRDAPVVVLDEPTASVDAASEALIADAVRRLAETHAVLLITHRTAGLAGAREIVVLHEGRVVERGRYDDLLARGTWFARMVALERDAIGDASSPTG
jgi:thiol reductant ABC exporter CydC subunit